MSRPLAWDDGQPIFCEWTPTGPDKTLRWACGEPAYVEVPYGLDASYYCLQHAPRDST